MLVAKPDISPANRATDVVSQVPPHALGVEEVGERTRSRAPPQTPPAQTDGALTRGVQWIQQAARKRPSLHADAAHDVTRAIVTEVERTRTAVVQRALRAADHPHNIAQNEGRLSGVGHALSEEQVRGSTEKLHVMRRKQPFHHPKQTPSLAGQRLSFAVRHASHHYSRRIHCPRLSAAIFHVRACLSLTQPGFNNHVFA